MVDARDFGGDKSKLWTLEDKWRRRITDYGAACERVGVDKTFAMALALYTDIATLELEAQKAK